MSKHDIEGIFIPGTADKPRVLAELFCELFSDEQAAFFDHVAAISEGWSRPGCFQWSMMDQDISPRARELLRQIHDQTSPAKSTALT